MGAGSVVCSIGFVWLGLSHDLPSYLGAWAVLGAAMSMTLYEAAFATINRTLEDDSRQAISTLTLFAGFASTIFWPLTLQFNNLLGWRNVYLAYGAAQLLICLPLHLLLPPVRGRMFTATQVHRGHTLAEALRHPAFWKLAMAFSLNMFIFAAMSVHLIPLLHDLGHGAGVAVFMSTLIGPMQVVGRIAERSLAKNSAPETVGKFCFATLPAALLMLLLFGTKAWAVAGFCILYGLSNGILTIVRGTIPQAMFGRENYGAISGALAGPSLLSKAAGPLLAAAILQRYNSPATLVVVLLASAAASLLFYQSAVKTAAHEPSALPSAK